MIERRTQRAKIVFRYKMIDWQIELTNSMCDVIIHMLHLQHAQAQNQSEPLQATTLPQKI